MKKIKFLMLIILCLCSLTLTSCSCSDEGTDDEPKTISVNTAVNNIKRDNNYRIQIETYLTETNKEEILSQQEYKVVLQNEGDTKKVEITYSEVLITIYQMVEEGTEYILFNPSLIIADATNTWVKATKDQLSELYNGSASQYSENEPKDKLTAALNFFTELYNFLMNLKDEYFTLNGVGNYEFNQNGKDALKNVFEDILKDLLEDSDNPLADGTNIDSKCTVRVNKKYITNLLTDIYVTPADTPDNKVTIKNITSFDKFKEVQIKLPTEITSFDEFVNSIEE